MNTPPGSRHSHINPAIAELAKNLRQLADKPAARAVLRGLEAAMPEAAAEVRAAMADPGAIAVELLARTFADGRAELAQADRTIARTLGKAFGRGVARGVAKVRPR